MASRSLWMDIEVAPDVQSLSADETCDVVVVGAGIAGISTAYELAKLQRSVIVIDRRDIAGGMTARTTAHLAPLCDDLTSELIKLRGAEMATGFYKSQAAAIDRIEEIQNKEKIDCSFRRLNGYLFQGDGMSADIIDEELDAVRSIGAPVNRVVGVPLANRQARQTLLYPEQATFHPSRYLRGLVKVCMKLGVRFFANTTVESVEERAEGVDIKTPRATIKARHAVIATNSPINDRVVLHTKMAPYRTYAMAFEIAKGALEDALYWDTQDPYHYVRLQADENGKEVVVVGGEDHKTGMADDAESRFEKLHAWTLNIIPTLGKEVYRWSGQVLDTIDYCAFMGLNPGSKRVYVSTGDSGQGMTHGVAGAIINAGLIVHGQSKYAEVYEPSRKPVRAIANYLNENATALKNFSEYLAPGELQTLQDLKPGRGAIVRSGLSKIAAYRNQEGALQLNSAACTHIGCHLHWNGFERSWDCPCHGSLFDVDGTALNAPAVSSLEPIDPRNLK